jgi:hypothetical protein
MPNTEPNAIEASYLAQGYRLPDGITWGVVHATRRLHGFAEHKVPVANAPGCIAWATPIKNGKHLKWRHLLPVPMTHAVIKRFPFGHSTVSEHTNEAAAMAARDEYRTLSQEPSMIEVRALDEDGHTIAPQPVAA